MTSRRVYSPDSHSEFQRPSSPSDGFSLIMVSILITVAAILLVAMLPGGGAGDYNAKTIGNVEKLQKVEEAMRSFMAFNGRRPCPADGQYNTSSKYFGVEAANPGNCQSGTPKAPMGPDSHKIVAGTIPVTSLGLPDDYAFDSYGRQFTYTVDLRATSNTACINLEGITFTNSTPVGKGGLVIHDGSGATIDNTMYAYISHGPSGYGAFPPQGSSVANRVNSGSTDADMQTNAGVNSSFNYNTAQFTNIRIKKDRVLPTSNDTGFDDLLWYRNDIKNTCCLGPKCTPPPGFIINGYASGQYSGWSIAIGDVNGDGIPDIIIGAIYASPNGLIKAGSVYVVFGTKNGFPDPLPLNTLNGTNGFELDGVAAGDNAGWSVAANDVNGDGIADVIIGARNASPGSLSFAGSVYVVFGKTAGWPTTPTTLNSAFLNGTNGFELDGAAATDHVSSVATGDVNGDGTSDLIIGAPQASPNGAQSGSVYVVFGKKCGGTLYPACSSPVTLNTAFLNGVTGVEFDGPAAQDWTGYSIATGDVNGDNVPDVIIGAPGASPGGFYGAGSVYVVFGKNPLLPRPVVTTTSNSTCVVPVAPTPGLLANQTVYSPSYIPAGTLINAVGVNCNNGGASCYGVYCMTLSAPATATTPGGGAIMYVSATPLNSSFLNGTTGAEFDGTAATSGFFSAGVGYSIATGDVNGDGTSDLIIGAPQASPNGAQSGSVYVVFGNKLGWSSPITLNAAFLNGLNGSEFDGTSSSNWAGISVGAGDLNNDGIADFIIAGGGKAYVVFGKKTSWSGAATPLNAAFLNGVNAVGFTGASVGSSAYGIATGDVNGDGIADLVLGGNQSSASGQTFVYFGKKKGWPTSPYNLGGL